MKPKIVLKIHGFFNELHLDVLKLNTSCDFYCLLIYSLILFDYNFNGHGSLGSA